MERSIVELGQTTIRCRFLLFFMVLLSALRHSKAFCLVAPNVGIGDNIDPCPLHWLLRCSLHGTVGAKDAVASCCTPSRSRPIVFLAHVFYSAPRSAGFFPFVYIILEERDTWETAISESRRVRLFSEQMLSFSPSIANFSPLYLV